MTEEQLKYMVDAVEGGHECYGMAHGYDAIPNPVESQAKSELQALKSQAAKEEQWRLDSVPCHRCNDGTAKDTWGREMTCSWCDGKGRVRRSY